MSQTWRQQNDKPMFPDLLWSKPENKRQAGKLLIIGGQAGRITEVSTAYNAAQKAGAGYVRVLLPESLRQMTNHLPDIEYAPANSSGSFARQSLGMMNEMTEWADAVLLAGGMGKNSETTTVIDGYLLRCPAQTTLTKDALQTISLPFDQILPRDIICVLNFHALQKRIPELNSPLAITSTMPLPKKAEIICSYTQGKYAGIVTQDSSVIWCSVDDEVTSTKSTMVDNTTLASYCSVWTMQHPDKKLEALTSAVHQIYN